MWCVIIQLLNKKIKTMKLIIMIVFSSIYNLGEIKIKKPTLENSYTFLESVHKSPIVPSKSI